MASLLEIQDMSVTCEGKPVFKALSLKLDKAQVVAVTGPAGSGKTALTSVLVGHPRHFITKGRFLYDGTDLTQVPPAERAKRGLFLAFQNPKSFPGVSVANFIRSSVKAARGASARVGEFRKELRERLASVGLDASFAEREMSASLSESEKKKLEILQLLCLAPKLAILDFGATGFDEQCLRAAADANAKGTALLILARDLAQFGPLKPNSVHHLP